jgi:hypothetical protein
MVRSAGQEKFTEMHDKVSDALDAAGTMVRTRIAEEASLKFDSTLEQNRVFLLDDPDMPSCLKPGANKAWRTLVPHVKDEFMTIVESEIGLRRAQGDDSSALPPDAHQWRCCCSCGPWLRAKFLYALYPFDKTAWGRMRNPLWWATQAGCVCTLLGISSACFLLILISIDREDHHQLVQFIMVFKQFQV